MVLAQDAAQVNRSKQIGDEIQYRKDLAQYESDLKAYEAEKARVEEANKKAKEKYERDLAIWQAQEAERKRKEAEAQKKSMWSGYDSRISKIQNEIKNLQARSSSMTRSSTAGLKTTSNYRYWQQSPAYGQAFLNYQKAKLRNDQRGMDEAQRAMRRVQERASNNATINNIAVQISGLQKELSKVQAEKASAVEQYQSAQRVESNARSRILASKTEQEYKRAVWQYRNTEFVRSRGLAQPYMTSAVSSALREYNRARTLGKGSAINRAYSRAEHLFMGGSNSQFDAIIKAEDANRKMALRQSAGLRAAGNRQIQSAIDKEMARLGGGTMVSSNLNVSSGRVPVASGTAEKAQDFGKGFTYETRAYGYIASGQAEIDRQQQIAKYEREQKLKAAGLDPNVPAGGMDMILNQPVLVTQTVQVAEPSKPRTPEERFEARKQGVLSATQQEQKAMKAFAELNKPQEVARYTPFVVGDKGFFSERAAINYANQINADPLKSSFAPAGSDVLGTGFREIQTNTKPVPVDKSVNQKNFVAPYLIPVEQRSFIGYGQDGKPIQGAPVPQGRFTVTIDGKERTFKDYTTAQKFIQRYESGYQTVQTPLSLQSFATKDLTWEVETSTGEKKRFASKEKAQQFLDEEQRKLPTSAEGRFIPFQNLYKFVDEKNTRIQEKLKKDPDNFLGNVIGATGTSIALGLDAITEGGKLLDKYVLKQPEPITRPVTSPTPTLESAGYEKVASDVTWIDTGLGFKRPEIKGDPLLLGGGISSFMEGAKGQAEKQGWVQTTAQSIVLAPQVTFDILSGKAIIQRSAQSVLTTGSKIGKITRKITSPTLVRAATSEATTIGSKSNIIKVPRIINQRKPYQVSGEELYQRFQSRPQITGTTRLEPNKNVRLNPNYRSATKANEVDVGTGVLPRENIIGRIKLSDDFIPNKPTQPKPQTPTVSKPVEPDPFYKPASRANEIDFTDRAPTGEFGTSTFRLGRGGGTIRSSYKPNYIEGAGRFRSFQDSLSSFSKRNIYSRTGMARIEKTNKGTRAFRAFQDAIEQSRQDKIFAQKQIGLRKKLTAFDRTTLKLGSGAGRLEGAGTLSKSDLSKLFRGSTPKGQARKKFKSDEEIAKDVKKEGGEVTKDGLILQQKADTVKIKPKQKFKSDEEIAKDIKKEGGEITKDGLILKQKADTVKIKPKQKTPLKIDQTQTKESTAFVPVTGSAPRLRPEVQKQEIKKKKRKVEPRTLTARTGTYVVVTESVSRLTTKEANALKSNVTPVTTTKISSRLNTRLNTKITPKQSVKLTPKLETKITPILKQKQPQALKSPTPQKPKARQLARPKSLIKPKARLATKAPNVPPLKQRVVPAGVPFDIQKKKEQKKDSKKRKRVEFIGNVKLDDIEGLIKRETIITGSKKVSRAERKGKKAKPKTFKVGFWKV